jgi:hypothetical protein
LDFEKFAHVVIWGRPRLRSLPFSHVLAQNKSITNPNCTIACLQAKHPFESYIETKMVEFDKVLS